MLTVPVDVKLVMTAPFGSKAFRSETLKSAGDADAPFAVSQFTVANSPMSKPSKLMLSRLSLPKSPRHHRVYR